MSRHANTSSEATKRKLVKAAEAELLERGYRRASVRHICARAELTTGALYHFFADKERLFEAVVEPASQGIIATLETPYEDAEAGPGLAVQRRVLTLADVVTGNRGAVRVLLGNQGHAITDGFENELARTLVARIHELASLRNPALAHTRTLAPEVAYWLALDWARRSISALAQARPWDTPALAHDLAFSTRAEVDRLLRLAERELAETP